VKSLLTHALCATQCDLKDKIVVKDEQVQALLAENPGVKHFRCSALTGENVETAFMELSVAAFRRQAGIPEDGAPAPANAKCCALL
jgi:GTPase SAR1 family protein